MSSLAYLDRRTRIGGRLGYLSVEFPGLLYYDVVLHAVRGGDKQLQTRKSTYSF